MSCIHCAAIKAERDDLREQVKAWDREGQGPVPIDVSRRSHWHRHLQIQPAAVGMLIAMVDATPHPVNKDSLIAASRIGRSNELEMPGYSLVSVRICQLRKRLKILFAGEAHPPEIRVDWGIGYSIPRESAARIRAFVGEP